MGDRDDKLVFNSVRKNRFIPKRWVKTPHRHSLITIGPIFGSKNVPKTFSRYVSPVLDVNTYKFYKMKNGWSIAIPIHMPDNTIKAIFNLIEKFGPSGAGYVRVGDVLVPYFLSPSNRMLLTNAAH